MSDISNTTATPSTPRTSKGEPRVSIPWPWYSINNLLDTLRVGTVTVLIADTGFGKTTVVEQCAAFWSGIHVPCRIAGTEIAGWELIARIAARELNLDVAALLRHEFALAARNSTLRPAEVNAQVGAQCLAVRARLSHTSFFDNDMPSVSALVADLTAWATDVGPGGVYVIDHIGQIDMGHLAGKPEGFRQAISALKAVAKKFGFALLCPVQLNREGRKKIHNFEAPDLSYAQGSSAIEQMAETVVFLTNAVAPKYHAPVNLRDGVRQLRSGLLRYEALVDSSIVTWHCLKSRDLGKRVEESRGQYASRPLKFDGNYYVSPRLYMLRSLLPNRWFSDTGALPSIEQILYEGALGILTDKETNALKGQAILNAITMEAA